MVHLFSRLTRLVARVDRSEVAITESDNGADGERPPTPTTAWLSSLMKASGTMLPIVAEARKLNADVDAWIDSLQLSTLEHERVQVGNRAYAFAMKVGWRRFASADFTLILDSPLATSVQIPA
jgi:hypothetical protein